MAASAPDKKDENLLTRWVVAAVSASFAESVTYPLDATKTRLQLQNELGRPLSSLVGPSSGSATVESNVKLGMTRTFMRMWSNEGPSAVYAGLPAAVLRQAVYGGIGIGMYQPVRAVIIGDTDPKHAPLWRRIIAGCLTGGFGQLVAAPTDVVKVCMQADQRLRLVGGEPRYSSTGNAFVSIAREEGISSFYKGIRPSLARAVIINGCGIASYDHSKQTVHRLLGTNEGMLAQALASQISGFISALVSTPFDVVKTRLMNQSTDPSKRLYTGLVDCAVKTVRAEGVSALYKGVTPAYMRLGPWQMVFFLLFERLSILVHGKEM